MKLRRRRKQTTGEKVEEEVKRNLGRLGIVGFAIFAITLIVTPATASAPGLPEGNSPPVPSTTTTVIVP